MLNKRTYISVKTTLKAHTRTHTRIAPTKTYIHAHIQCITRTYTYVHTQLHYYYHEWIELDPFHSWLVRFDAFSHAQCVACLSLRVRQVCVPNRLQNKRKHSTHVYYWVYTSGPPIATLHRRSKTRMRNIWSSSPYQCLYWIETKERNDRCPELRTDRI